MTAEEKLKASGISEEFRMKTFENFNYEKNIELMEAFVKAKNYSKYFNEIKNSNVNSIMFLGQVGSGKTHLSISIVAFPSAITGASCAQILMQAPHPTHFF